MHTYRVPFKATPFQLEAPSSWFDYNIGLDEVFLKRESIILEWSRGFLAEGAPERSGDYGGESLVPESVKPVSWAPERVSDGRT